MIRALLLASALLVSACASGTQTVRQTVAATAVTLGIAATAYDTYARLPRCGRPNAPKPPACSDPQTVVNIGNSLHLARSAVLAARDLANTLPEAATPAALPSAQAAVVTNAEAAVAQASKAVEEIK